MSLRCVAVVALGFALAASPCALVRDAVAGDARVADTLFKSGKQALSKGDFEGAITFFTKAFGEDSGLIEACWWRGSALEKSGNKADALAAYREYVTLFEGKSASGAAMSKEEQRLKGLADKTIDALAGGEKEFKKLEDSFVAALLAFAKEHFVRDPGVSRKAVDAILASRPEHEDALKLREKLGGPAADAPDAPSAAPRTGPGAASPATGPFRAVKAWKDLLADQTIHASGTIVYERGVMVVDTKGGSKVMPNDPIDLGESFAYEMEFQVAETYERGWFTGLVFGAEEGIFYTAFASQGRVVILRSASSQEEMASWDMPPLDTKEWHRFGIIVKGPQVDVWLGGKKVLTWREPGGAGLGGELGFLQQRCRTERRVYRAGKAE